MDLQLVRLFWIVNFFMFSIVLFFVWSKMFLVSKKIRNMSVILEEIDKVKAQTRQFDTLDIPSEKPEPPVK